MKLLIRGDEIGYISDYDDQSFGMFCPVAIICNKGICEDIVSMADHYEAEGVKPLTTKLAEAEALIEHCLYFFCKSRIQGYEEEQRYIKAREALTKYMEGK